MQSSGLLLSDDTTQEGGNEIKGGIVATFTIKELENLIFYQSILHIAITNATTSFSSSSSTLCKNRINSYIILISRCQIGNFEDKKLPMILKIIDFLYFLSKSCTPNNNRVGATLSTKYS